MALPTAVAAAPCRLVRHSGLPVAVDIGLVAPMQISTSHQLRSRSLRPLLERIQAQTISPRLSSSRRSLSLSASANTDENAEPGNTSVKAVLFDMDGVLCDSEEPSRAAAVALFAEMGYSVSAEDFVPFMGTGEANFLGGVARVYGVPNFDSQAAKKRFFEIYIDQYAKPDSGIGFPGALQLVQQCKSAGLRVAVASSADRVKVNANLAAAGLPIDMFDAIMSADKFERLKPAPDIFLAAAQALGVPTAQCVVIEDALAGVQAVTAAGMRSIAVTTTLPASDLEAASPALIRPNIAGISLADIFAVNDGGDGSSHAERGSPSSSTSISTTASATSSGSSSISGAAQSWLDQPLNIPGSLSTSRRSVLRASSLAVGLAGMAFTIDNFKTLSYVSPRALLNLLLPPVTPAANAQGADGLRSYVERLDKKGGGDLIADFEPRLPWLNSPPLSFSRELRGKLVLLDFWTYCCINCMHVLPDLKALETKYSGEPLVVVGVHSAKFDNEKDLEAIRSAVLRYDISHPVVNDGEMTMWRALGVSSWPTLALIGPDGRLIGMLAGEGNKQLFDDLIAASLDYYGQKGVLDRTPVPLSLEREKDDRLVKSPLKFPGKIATDLANGRLFISDSNNHRIVVTDLSGRFLTAIGSGEEGLADGTFDVAQFNRPQGVAYDSSRNTLLVADTENHALRLVDLTSESVTTAAGSGEKGRDYKGGSGGRGQELNSPWDVELSADKSAAYVAMAGQHQIWRWDVQGGTASNFSGSGYERNQNGRTSNDTAYAQPSGLSLSLDGKELFEADSESSSIRAVNLRTGGSRLLAGGDPNFAENLFKFGDRDGPSSQVLLQHPLAVLCLPDGRLVLTDSYNHKIKLLDPSSSNRVQTVAGSGMAGFADGRGADAQFSEPAGLAMGPNGTVFVADTNNSVIRILDLSQSPAAVSTLTLTDVPQTAPPSSSSSSAPSKRKRLRRRQAPEAEVISVAAVVATAGKLQLRIAIPDGYHFTEGASSRFEVTVPDDSPSLSVSPADGTLSLAALLASTDLSFSVQGATPATAQINCKIYYCQQDDVCLYKAISFIVPFTPADGQAASITTVPLDYTIKAPSTAGTRSTLPAL